MLYRAESFERLEKAFLLTAIESVNFLKTSAWLGDIITGVLVLKSYSHGFPVCSGQVK